MGRKQLSSKEVTDLIWICRRLATALREGEEIVPALEAMTAQAPPGPAKLLRAMQESFLAGNNLGRGLIPLGFPSYIWGAILTGELTSLLPSALTRLADRLETELAAPKPNDLRLYSYSLAFGRLGMLLKTGVPVIQALESAAESVNDEDVQGAFEAVKEVVQNGGCMASTFAQVADDLPVTVIEIIAEAEKKGNIGDALTVVSDYLLDEAGQ